jgi:hypothetical protein
MNRAQAALLRPRTHPCAAPIPAAVSTMDGLATTCCARDLPETRTPRRFKPVSEWVLVWQPRMVASIAHIRLTPQM